MLNKKIELLAPAGDLERLKVNLLYGADAVYFGGKKYSLRANASNFGLEEIKEACDFAHKLGKKVFLTLNIVFHNEDIEGVEEYIKQVVECGIDAFIISDPFIINHIVTNYPNVEAHLSTQNSTTNKDTVLFFKEQGVKRVVLAREVSLKEMKEIIDVTKTDIEVFVHGAMCTFYSGRCCLSNYVTNRDSNRGGCAQICRWTFNYLDKNKEKITEEPFSITPKDLNMVPFIKEMIDIGVNSFKIEGRMRSIYYIATVILIYRRLIDKIRNNTLTEAYTNYCLNVLNRCANRESTPQFFDKLPTKDEQYFLGREEVSNQDFLGIVLDYTDGIVTLEQRNYFKVGDIVQFFGPNIETTNFVIPEIFNENNETIDVSNHPRMIVKFACPIKLNKDDLMRIKIFDI